MTLEGARVVVLGGSSGIGLATAEAAAKLGADVVIAGRDERRLAAAAQRLGTGVTGAPVDATDRGRLDAFFAALDRIDHLVLALSGSAGAGPIATLSLDDLRGGLEGKLLAHVSALQAALPRLAGTGSVTFVSAASAGAPIAGAAGLAAINGAIESMVPALAVELKPRRVNAVSPGVVDTPWWNDVPADQRADLFAHFAASSPVGRVGAADDVARAIISLIGNDFITGTVLTVDGGFRLAAAA
jgi:NAD(P)-dependent dehydrogenase (short-subunit alcohol dehydrogenase family)